METRRNYFSFFAALLLILVAGGTYFALRRSPEDIAREKLQAAAKKVERKAKNKLMETLGDAAVEGGELAGNDEKGRPLWSVGAEKSEVRSGEGDELQATLTGAHATLYREGVPETTFRSAKMELTRDANDKVRLVLSGGVTAKTSGQAIAQVSKQASKNAKKKLSKAPPGTLQMQSKDAEIDVDRRQLIAKNGVVLTQGDGDKTVKVTAPQLSADAGLTNAQLSGGIVATAPQGTFKAPSATWNWKNHRLAVAGGVTATHEGTTIKGARLEADTQSKNGTIVGDVQVSAPQGHARAQSVTYNWDAGRITARGDVTLTKGAASLRAGTIECDDKLQNAFASGGVTLQKDGVRLTAGNARATNGLSRASASGGVTISKDDVTLRAASIQSFDNFQRAEASGAVHLTKGNTSLRAGHAEVFDKGQRAVASGGVTVTQGNLSVSANRAEATNLNQKGALHVVATGDVALRQADWRVHAGRAEATNADSESARRVIASGGVTAQNAGGWVRASHVTWSGGQIQASGGTNAKRGELMLSAQNFAGDDKGQNAVLTGKVLVRHSNGASLQAPSARYTKKENRVFASGGIVYKDANGSVLHGQSLVADLNLKQAQISGLEGKVNLRSVEGKSLF